VTTFELREPTEEDAQAVADLCNALDAAFVDTPERASVEDVLQWWRRESEQRLVLDGGRLVGFAYIQKRNGRWDGDGYVHPDEFGRGVGTAILDWLEARARKLGSPELRNAIVAEDERAACLLRNRGFERIRTFFRMLIDLDAEPPASTWPQGFSVASLAAGEERELYQVLEDAFVDHWGHTERTYEVWLRTHVIEHDVCFLVRTNGDIAAGALCRSEQFGMGWVDVLGTRREFRRKGLGDALLRHAFRELYRRGARQVGLGVDAENPTGATRLYERAGMRVVSNSDLYSKPL
jgi:mycothiol synthase